MRPTIYLRSFTVALASLLASCTDRVPLAPERAAARPVAQADTEGATLATIRRATARYHDLDVALADGFVLLHPCENRPGEGPVGIVYVHFGRVLDGVVDPALPDALIYEPSDHGRPTLVGAEFAVLNTGQPAPTFLGESFQAEEEFGVWGLHAWVWRHNPEGMFAESNPRVSCGEE